MTITKRKARSKDPALIKLPVEYMKRILEELGSSKQLVYIIEELPENKILITPKVET